MSANELDGLKEQYATRCNLEARIALHARYSTADRELQEWEFAHFELPLDARILEIGCGTGLFWDKNRARLPATWRLFLSDLSIGMLQSARASGLTATLANLDARSIPFRAEYFDAVVANHMLYHIPDLDRVLSEIRRVLRHGGKLYAVTNGAGHLRELADLAGMLGVRLFSSRLSFLLDDGEQKLARHFSRIQRFDFPNALVITDVEPVVAYMRSTLVGSRALVGEAEQRLRQLIADRIKQEGALRVTKATGLFEATKS